jgi:uncharacterized phage protein (TIGR01671 family)
MKEIKFRCWDKGQMYYLELIGNNFMWINEQPQEGQLMQHTGITDKNGKDIYEGDILIYGDDKPCEIVFEKGQFTFAYERETPTNSRMGLGYYKEKEIEVVGNIYQNKELLK